MTVKCSAKCLASHLVPLCQSARHQDDHRPGACLFKCGERAISGRYGFLFCIDIRLVQRPAGDDIETEIKNNDDREQARKHGADASKSATGQCASLMTRLLPVPSSQHPQTPTTQRACRSTPPRRAPCRT